MTLSGLLTFSLAATKTLKSGRSRWYVAWDWLLRAFSCDPHKNQRRGLGGESPLPESTPTEAVFLKLRIACRRGAFTMHFGAAGIEVWFD